MSAPPPKMGASSPEIGRWLEEKEADRHGLAPLLERRAHLLKVEVCVREVGAQVCNVFGRQPHVPFLVQRAEPHASVRLFFPDLRLLANL
eukprot:1034675-Rhodomonas_salina.2